MTLFATEAGLPARLTRTALATRDQASYSHYNVILIMTSLATKLATPSVTVARTPYRV